MLLRGGKAKATRGEQDGCRGRHLKQLAKSMMGRVELLLLTSHLSDTIIISSRYLNN